MLRFPTSRLLILSLLLLSLWGCQPQASSPPPLPASTVTAQRAQGSDYRVASWNVRNLFDAVDHPNQDEVLKPKAYQAKLKELKVVVEALDADFLALQEVENLSCLEDLNRSLERPYPQMGLLEGNDRQRGIDVAFLSRLPVAEVRSHAEHVLPSHPDTPKRYHFSRDCLEVQLAILPPVTLLVNHLKSSRGGSKRSAAKRRVQALGVVEIAAVVENPEGGCLVILGDLNDRQDSWSLEPLFEKFYDAFEKVPAAQRVTHRWRKGGSALDHILLDEDGRKISGEARIWRDLARQTSDHDPVSVQMTLAPLQPATVKVWGR